MFSRSSRRDRTDERCRIKDKHNCIPAEYLNPDGKAIDKIIIRSLAIAMAEFALGGADIASDGEDDGERGSGSGSDSD